MHHTPTGPSTAERLRAVRTSWWQRGVRLRGKIAPVVLVCGIVAGIALVLPEYAPAVTSAEGGLSASGTSAGTATATGEARTDVVQLGVDGTDAPPPAAPEATQPAPSAPVEEPAPSTGTAPGTATEEQPAPETTAETTAAEETTATSPAPAQSGGSTPASAPAAAAAPADAGAEGQVLALVNRERAAAGCGPVVADEGLASVARAFSADMRDRGFFSHTDPDGLSPFDRGDRAGVTVLAENIAYGQPDAAAVMADWMDSAGHRANILNCSLTRLGVGVAQGPGGPWWTQNFA
ncbi:CAP domain-containing protein [Geodermatophilus sp. SYSU D00815]